MWEIDGKYIKDEDGRVLFLRGVNLSGGSKLPFDPYMPTHKSATSEFYDHRNVSFIGRPFPLEEADQHFARLKRWGFLFCRFLVTWEALEHAGP